MDSYLIFLADDHVLIRQGLRKIIDGVADLVVVGEAGDGRELLSLMSRIDAHMVILDVSMPHLGGIETVREIKAKYPDMKVLILTMHKEYLQQALSAGADGYLVKQDADRELFSAIEKIRRGQAFISPRVAEGMFIPFEPLSLREKEIMRLIAAGKSNKEAAEMLALSIRTVECHRAAILNKLHIKNTAELVKYAIQEGYV